MKRAQFSENDDFLQRKTRWPHARYACTKFMRSDVYTHVRGLENKIVSGGWGDEEDEKKKNVHRFQ